MWPRSLWLARPLACLFHGVRRQFNQPIISGQKAEGLQSRISGNKNMAIDTLIYYG